MPNADAEPTFEQNLERLEQIVAELEKGNLGLDDSLNLFEEGIQRYRRCTQKLTSVETRIHKLVETLDGELEVEDL
jgi:exodeoxyribonuclease VII small subunit